MGDASITVNKHGLKMYGLIFSSLRTTYISDNSSDYIQIQYNMVSGKVTAVRCRIDDCLRIPEGQDIIVCATRRHMSRQTIADTVMDAVEMYRYTWSEMQSLADYDGLL